MSKTTMPILPVEAYTSQEWFDKEQELIFGNTWQFAGLMEDIQDPGDYITVQCGHQNIVVLNNQTHELTIGEDKTILQSLKEANLNPSFSCESGVCGTCVAKVTNGKAEMKSCMALDDDDIEKGLILTC